MGPQIVGRPSDKHIDAHVLNALVPWSSETWQVPHGLSPEAVREAERHVESCGVCSAKVLEYRQLLDRFSNAVVSEATTAGANCPKDEDVDWHEVAAGLWPESEARQLIMHAALCAHCGPLLRAATSVNDDPTPQEAKLLAQLKAPSRPVVEFRPEPIPFPPWSPPVWQQFLQWRTFVPVAVLMVIVGVISTRRPSSPTPLSGPTFAEFAVRTHRQHAQGSLALDVRSSSQQILNEWFKAKLQFSLALPVSPAAPGEDRPYRLEGARLVRVGGKSAAFIAYQLKTAQPQTAAASLMVTPDSVAVASGGVKVDYTKVTFHYATVEGYKVVTWSVHGLTYALVSDEGNSTQRSCMICHSAMRDRDLSQTPTPLRPEPVLQ
jgi:anti-sigma factor RsiW